MTYRKMFKSAKGKTIMVGHKQGHSKEHYPQSMDVIALLPQT